MERVSLTGGGHRLNNLAANKKVSAPMTAGPTSVAIHISLNFLLKRNKNKKNKTKQNKTKQKKQSSLIEFEISTL